MPSYDFITHPNSKKKVKLNSKSGQNIIQNYIIYINSLFRQEGGSAGEAGDNEQQITALNAKIATKKAALANLRGEVERAEVTALSQERERRKKQKEAGESAAEDPKTLQEVEVVLAAAQKSKVDLEEKTQELAANLQGALAEMEKRRKAKEEGENLQCILCKSPANTLKNSYKLASTTSVLCFNCIVNKFLIEYPQPQEFKFLINQIEINKYLPPGGIVIDDPRGIPEDLLDRGAAATKGKPKRYIDLTNSNFIDNLADSNKRLLIKFIEIVREAESIELTGRKAKLIAARELIEKEQIENTRLNTKILNLLSEIKKKNKRKNVRDIGIAEALISTELANFKLQEEVADKFIDKILEDVIPRCPYCQDDGIMHGIANERGGGCAAVTCANSWCTTSLLGRTPSKKLLLPQRSQFCGWCIKHHRDWKETSPRTEDGATYAFQHTVNEVVHEHISKCVRKPGSAGAYFVHTAGGINITGRMSQEALGGRAGDILKKKLDSREWHALSPINKGRVMSFFIKMRQYHDMRERAKLRYDIFENFSRPGAVKETFSAKGNRGYGLSWLIKDNILPSFLGGSLDTLGPDIINAGQAAVAEHTIKVQELKNKLRNLQDEGQRQDGLPDPVVDPVVDPVEDPVVDRPEAPLPPPMGDHEEWESLSPDDIESKIVALELQIKEYPPGDERLDRLRYELETLLTIITSRTAPSVADLSKPLSMGDHEGWELPNMDEMTGEIASIDLLISELHPDHGGYEKDMNSLRERREILSAMIKSMETVPDGQHRERVQRVSPDNDSRRAELRKMLRSAGTPRMYGRYPGDNAEKLNRLGQERRIEIDTLINALNPEERRLYLDSIILKLTTLDPNDELLDEMRARRDDAGPTPHGTRQPRRPMTLHAAPRAKIISLITGRIGITMNEVDKRQTTAATIFHSALNLYIDSGESEEFYMEARFNWAEHVVANDSSLEPSTSTHLLADLTSSNIQERQRALTYVQARAHCWRFMDVNGNF